MKIFSLFILAQVTHQFSLRNFGEVPEELLLEVGNDIDADTLDLDSINEVFTKQLDNLTNNKNSTQNNSTNIATNNQDDSEDGRNNLRRKDKDDCPMDGSEIFQMKLYWSKGTEWQGSKREKAWCAQCEKKCKSGEILRLKQCDEDDKEQFWIFENCMVKPMINPDVCITTGEDKEKSGHQGKIELKKCRSKYKKNQKFRMYDPDDIFEKFNFKILSDRKQDDRICLSSEHHPRSGESLRFFSCKKAYLNDGGKKKKDDTSHWVVGEFDGH